MEKKSLHLSQEMAVSISLAKMMKSWSLDWEERDMLSVIFPELGFHLATFKIFLDLKLFPLKESH